MKARANATGAAGVSSFMRLRWAWFAVAVVVGGCRPAASAPGDAGGPPPDAGAALDEVAVPDAGDASVDDVAVRETVAPHADATFGDVAWSCSDELPMRRAGGVWSSAFRPGDGGDGATVMTAGDDGPPACHFFDAQRALVISFEGEWGQRRVTANLTADGGVTWSSVVVSNDRYTDWPLGPEASLVVRDARQWTLVVVDPPQHHNSHRMTTNTFSTVDGGHHWTRVGQTSKCVDPETHCKSG